MKTSNMTYNEYWAEVQNYLGIHDTVTVIMNDNDEEVIQFKDSCGCLLSEFNIDREEVRYY